MTVSNTAIGATKSAPAATSLAPALSDLQEAALLYATAKVSRKVEDWADGLNDFVASGGPTTQAVFAGLGAMLRGKNPVWAAIKGAWSGASPQLKLAVVLILILTMLLSPVVLLVLLLGLLIAALVAGIRAATR
ncbi:hypothetical protein EV651_102301 [Kribbella sp. VKM Ac-2571]|uniref:hypothetical protein n=1 Tax=Kribbella sp. VKM Ac-2571 TaxID=2512222 RepID=UPI00106218A2|nr:hypothetical protein [Kribbella sp. VKM Ac-2571]TDO68382.1 hypothetical protein EV651_102301 [Kribbella sp. VKM Ac-2571]